MLKMEEISKNCWPVHVGSDFPDSVQEELRGCAVTLNLMKERGKPSTRGLLEYQDTTFGPKKFQYTTQILPVKNEWLEGSGSLASRAFHFLEGPAMLENRVSALLNLRAGNGITEVPLII
ncbi:hypothetical protein ACJ73_06928 [Blastomyces percursus]|uniref:Uncharacterized protein n=1 Tax=Blastomyces percursus TaxID=1658174 RepID=A0A1J9R125_9EURO|nr:hypothetical protein ACJ73_06928 [Blastomyces percursus]